MHISVPIFQRKHPGGHLVWTTLGLGALNTRTEGRSDTKMQQSLVDDLRRGVERLAPEDLPGVELMRGMSLEREHLEFSIRGGGKRLKISGNFPLVLEPRWFNQDERVIVAYHPERQREWFPFDADRSLSEQAAIFFQSAWIGLDDWQIDDLKANGRETLRVVSFIAKPGKLLDRLKRSKKEPDEHALLGGAKKRRSGYAVLPDLGVDQTLRAIEGNLDAGRPRAPYREQLQQLVCGKRARSVVLIGRSGSGKSTLLNQVVCDRLSGDDYDSHRNLDKVHRVWRISGRRLIAGMSYVGQWEQRCTELLEDVRKRKIVLWIDDLHAWGRIGQSRSSERCLADFFRGPIARGEVHVVAECTQEQFTQLEEDAPALAAALTRLYVAETSPAETMRMMIHESRHIELAQDVAFDPLCFRTIYELGGSLLAGQAFPGKALELLRTLGRRYTGRGEDETIGSKDVVRTLSERTGIPSLLLESKVALDVEQLERAMSRNVIGQPDAQRAAVDLIVRIKAGLTDARRPYGVYLFTGPTGTGKTEMAKAIATYLYGDESRLVRLDMSEYATAHASSRLIGDRFEPDGVLTRQVRQQPFCVVLLDEIEKAHPSILNLMLQLFDEGRLTDAAGQVADFTHAVVIMTSNLGSRKNVSIGFGEEDTAEVLHDVLQSVKGFFAPELFNRIDRVVPFGPLSSGVARKISEKEVGRLTGRRGLTERNIFLTVHAGVLDRITREGFDARDGARSLKRYLEDHVSTLLTEEIVRQPGGVMRILRLFTDEQGDFALYAQALTEAEPAADAARLEPMLQRTEAELASELPGALEFLEQLEHSDDLMRVSGELGKHLEVFNVQLEHAEERGEGGPVVELTGLADQIYNLDTMRSVLHDFRTRIEEYLAQHEPDEAERIERELDVKGLPYDDNGPFWSSPEPAHKRRLAHPSVLRAHTRRMGKEDVLENLAEIYFLRQALERVREADRHAIHVELTRVGEAHRKERFGAERDQFLALIAETYATARGEFRGFCVRDVSGSIHQGKTARELVEVLGRVRPRHVVLEIVGLCVRDFFAGEHGCHVRTSLSTTPEIVRVSVAPATPGRTPEDVVREHIEAMEAFEAALERGGALPKNPEELLPVVRRMKFELPEDVGQHFMVDVEDFPLCYATRRRVRGLGEAFRVIWMLRMSVV